MEFTQRAKYDKEYLVYVIAALRDEGVVVGEEVGPLQHAVQLQLGLVPGLRGDGDCKKIRRNHRLGLTELIKTFTANH